MLHRQRDGYVAHCDRCRVVRSELLPLDFEEAREKLLELGWLECARRGRGRQKWDWWCPSCKPNVPTGTFGASTR